MFLNQYNPYLHLNIPLMPQICVALTPHLKKKKLVLTVDGDSYRNTQLVKYREQLNVELPVPSCYIYSTAPAHREQGLFLHVLSMTPRQPCQ